MNQGPTKNVSILQEGGSTLVPPTKPVFRVILLHTERFEQIKLCSAVHSNNITVEVFVTIVRTLGPMGDFRTNKSKV